MKLKLLNIIAYEMCPYAPYDYAVNSYICSLYELINHPNHVKELRSKKILYNCLDGSDEEVAHIFNEIANDLVGLAIYVKPEKKNRILWKKRKTINCFYNTG